MGVTGPEAITRLIFLCYGALAQPRTMRTPDMDVRITHEYKGGRPGQTSGDLEDRLYRLEVQLGVIKEIAMAVSADVQRTLDLARQLPDLAKSVDAGMKALSQQVTDLQNQIANASGLSDDDKAALQEATTDMQTTIDSLKTDIPANVPTSTPPADTTPVDPSAPAGTTPAS